MSTAKSKNASATTGTTVKTKTKSDWKRKDLVAIESLDPAEIEILFAQADVFKPTLDSREKYDSLHGHTVVNLFLEPSTRTRTAFEVSAKRLGADVISIAGSASSLVKGETLRDTALNIRALNADMIIMRHSAAGSAQYLANTLDIPVINAGDGAHAHPTQALLDAYTLREHFGHGPHRSLKGLHVTILGDILFSRVARSNIHCLTKLGVHVTLAGPTTLVPETFNTYKNVRVVHDLREALHDADAVMLLRIQHERQTTTHFPSLGEYTSMFGLNRERESWLKPGAIVMHPGPINRGVEVESEIADGPRSVILEQVHNGIAVRMAVLHLCAKACEARKNN
ncbi:MAG: aspartate carbamoyltransferase catalytic subunit [Puniceicoccales bacterium]|jgi:aspartate carbamoyltransferase catalytic subunit|nr:aspartate carbamoyltransferase catalytic subunit [Puniceicoccales bacterium]